MKQISNKVNQRFRLVKGALSPINIKLGNRSMGSSNTLKDFIVWGMKTYPAKKYVLILWNHGAGAVNGFGFDELNEDTSLTVDEIQKAMKDAYAISKQRLEVVGFDACLMGNIETANAIKNYANYLVASEELEPGHGWNYDTILRGINSKPTIAGDALGKIIVDGFKAQAVKEETDKEITLSVINLSKIAAVNTALDVFIKRAYNDIQDPQRIAMISKARIKAEDYGSSEQDQEYTDMADLFDIADNAKELYLDESSKLMKAIKEAVVYKINSISKPNANGLSIYFPCRDKDNFAENLKIYQKLDFVDSYKKFVNLYANKLLGDKTPVKCEDSIPEKDQEDGSYGVQVDPEEVYQVSEAYTILGVLDEKDSNKLIILGRDSDVEVDEETGELNSNFNGNWITLNGQFVTMMLMEEGEDYSSYSIPAKLNGEEVDIQVLFSKQYPEGLVLGAWPGIDEETGVPDRDIIKIKAGDKIIPMYIYNDTTTGEEEYIDGEEFIVGQNLKLESTPLPKGEYYIGFI